MARNIAVKCLTKKARKYAEAMGFDLDKLDARDCLEMTIMAGSSHKVYERKLAAAEEKARS